MLAPFVLRRGDWRGIGAVSGRLALLVLSPLLVPIMIALRLTGEMFARPVVILSGYDDAHTVSRALKAGAAGFVPKAYSSDRLLAALRQVPRHLFVPAPLAAYAYQDMPLPIGFDKTISQPFIVALMTEPKELWAVKRVGS